MRKSLLLLMILNIMIMAVFPSIAQDNTIVDIVIESAEAEEDAQFTILLSVVLISERLTEALSDPDGEYTVFAPTDEAFTAFFELVGITEEELLAEPDIAEAVLLYHVVEGVVSAEDVIELDGEEVSTLLGDFAPVTIEVIEDGDVLIIDAIDLEELEVAEEDNNATVVTPDIEAENGIIHMIDNVLIPNDDMLQQHFAMQEDMMDDSNANDDNEADNTIAGIVIESSESDEPQFTVLLQAIQAADESILTALSNPEADLTVFAPTDEAFATLLETMEIDVDELLADTDFLNSVLAYHVIDGEMMAETILTLDGELVPTSLGEDATISITVTDDGVILNDSIMVTTTDIQADNGVIHVIDGVLVATSDE